MSGHSKWATTHRQKAVVDAKRGAIFTKLGNMIAIAARGGVDPAMNPNLAVAIEKAKQANMPAANIQRAIDRVADKNAAQLEEVLYEAYGPNGVGVIIEAATDNRNRTFPEVRTAVTKNGGNMAEPGAVSFGFSRMGVLRLNLADQPENFAKNADDLLLQVLDCGAEDAEVEGDELTAYTEMKNLHKVRENLVAAGLKIADAGLEYVAKNPVEISGESVAKFEKIFDAVDELDDVVAVWTNANITE
jgi:YebC/PmpR family DNA-binding regulatory protein